MTWSDRSGCERRTRAAGRERAADAGRVVRPHTSNGPRRSDRSQSAAGMPMTEEVMRVAGTADLAVVAALGLDGHPSAWPLAGPLGIVMPLGRSLLSVRSADLAPPALGRQIAHSAEVAILALNVASGAGAELHGDAAAASDRLAVAIDRARVTRLAPDHEPLIRASSSVFIATREGRRPAITHGQAGDDVEVTSERSLLLRGHVAERVAARHGGTGDACLLFVDFPNGRWLQVLVRPDAGRDRSARVLEAVVGGRLARRWAA